MKAKKKEVLKDLYELLLDAHLSGEQKYEMIIEDSDGVHIEHYSRERYLDFIIGVAVEKLGETFPRIVEGE